MDTPDLIIPVRFDYRKGAADLRAAEGESKRSAKASADAQVKAHEDAEKSRRQAAKETADFIARSNKEIADKGIRSAKEKTDAEVRSAKEAATAEARAAKDAAATRRRADHDAFRAWKADQDQRHRLAMKAWQEEQAGIKQIKDETAGLIKVQMGLSAVRGIGSAIGDEFKRAADYTREVAMHFADIRQAIQVVAGLKDKQNSNEYALEHAQKAAALGMVPEEYAKGQETFLNAAAGQLKGPNAKMTPAQGEEFMNRVGRLAKAKGYDAADSMGFAAAILQQAKGPITVEEAMKRFNQGFINLQEGPIDARQGVGMMSGLMAHGVSSQEASTMLNIVAPVARPGEELTSAESALKAIEEMRVSRKGEAFGVTDKMSQYEAVKAFSKNLYEREQALKAKGLNENEIDVEISRQMKAADVADEIREKRGLYRGMAKRGIGMKEFETYEANVQNISPTADLPIVEAHSKGAQGRAEMRKAQLELKKAEIGYEEQPALEQVEEGEIAATGKKKFNRSGFQNIPGNMASFFTGVSVTDQIKNEEALLELRRRAAHLGITEDVFSKLPPEETMVSAKDVMFRSQESVNAEMNDLLRLIDEKLGKGNQIAERTEKAANRPPTLPPGVMPMTGGGRRP